MNEQALLRVLREIVKVMEDQYEMIYPWLNGLIDECEAVDMVSIETTEG